MNKEKQKIKILTWNLGQYIWIGFLGRFFPVHGYKNVIQNYNRGNAQKIKEIINHVSPDILISQELDVDINIKDFWPKNNDNYSLSESYYKNFQKLYIGKEEGIVSFKKEHKELTIIEFSKFVVFSVHLNAFSAQKRLSEIKYLCSKSQNYNKPIICLGDFNLWKRGNFFLFNNDKKAYNQMLKYFTHASKNILSTTTTGFSLDNIFTKNIDVLNSGVKKENGKYMDHYPLWIDFEI